MIRITNADFQKLVKFLAKEGQDGATLAFFLGTHSGSSLMIKTVDRSNKEISIELSDADYPFMPRVTRTETF